MSEWGRKEYTGWPSRAPVWTCAAVFVWLLIFAGGMVYRYTQQWSFAEQEYLGNYVRASTFGWLWDESYYQLLTCVDKKGENHVVIGNEIESGKMANGETGYRVTEEGAQAGAVGVEIEHRKFSNSWMRETLEHDVYQDQTMWEYVKYPAYGSLCFVPMLLFFAVPKDRKRELEFQHGRRLRGPELLTTVEFNGKLGRRRRLRREPADGLGFINENRSWADGTFRNRISRCVRIPRERESMHVLVMGDTGQGKSAIVRQALCQIEERGETAIVYDPAMEYLPQFYEPERGDVILNPLDERCPFWTPGDEVPHEAEALTLAASLFPEQGRENRFFVEAPRKIFAHLLNLKPTPEQLTAWLSNPEEIDRRVKGTEMAAMIDPRGGPQRSGVLGSLNMVADAFKLLPKEPETTRRWSTTAWAKERKGWIFITSKPTVRERLRPLISLWLDLLVLRMMDEGSAAQRKTWFVLDELGSLQRLPQLTTAITESRKSNCPMILGFQGKAQIETLYGTISEALLSQPATKIYLKTSEPNAAEWISKAIGEVEIERCRETRTHGQSPQARNSESQQRDISREPLVMASQILGLDPLDGYLKHGNYVVELRVPYLQLAAQHEKFVPRKPREDGPADMPPPVAPPGPSEQPMELKPPSPSQGQAHFFE